METKMLTWETAVSQYLATLTGKNRSAGTIRGYTTNLLQFQDYVPVASPIGVTRAHINDFLTYCGTECQHSGVYRARALSVIREFFRFLVAEGYLDRSPAENIGNPAKE